MSNGALKLRDLHHGKIMNIQDKCQEMWFEGVYRELEIRASGNNYRHLTVDNLTFLEENTRDDPVAALKGTDTARKAWDKKYGSLVRQLEWRCYKLSDYLKFQASFAERNPALACTVQLFTVNDGATTTTHPSDCYKLGSKWRGCDICNLLYALDKCRSERTSVESELMRHATINAEDCNTKRRVVMFNEVGLSIKCSWVAPNGRPTMFEVSGPLGAVLQGTDWDRVLNVDADAELSGPEMENEELSEEEKELPTKKRTTRVKRQSPREKKQSHKTKPHRIPEFFGPQRGVGSDAWDKERKTKEEEETPPPDAHLICCHDGHSAFIHRQKDGLCWETRNPKFQIAKLPRSNHDPHWYWDEFIGGWRESVRGYRKRQMS